jgi:tetratricopeptide (TPR) repeat protein
MPRANPNASFEVATKHLFRHLHEPDNLRDNPLARCFFETTGALGTTRVADRLALERIHGLLRAAAEFCRDEDLAAGNAERARRQHAIAIEGCLEGKAVRTVARALGISSTQYYRERADICARLARYLRDAGDPRAEAAAPPFDDFRYGMIRAASMAELGDPERAIEEYIRLFDSTDSASQKVEVLCETALAYSRGDAREDVDRLLGQARALLERTGSLSPRDRRIAEAHVGFVRGMSTWAADPSSALELFHAAISILERLAHPSDRTRELHARILFEYGEGLATFQGLRKSVETLSVAAKILETCREPSPHLSLRIEITLRVFRNSMLVDPFGWEPLHQRLQTMLELGERARLTGSVDLTLRALNAISQLYACSGDAVAARHAVQSALALSKYHPTKELFSEVSLRMARTLMYTALWQDVPSVLRVAGAPATVAVAASRKTLGAEYALRRGMYAQVSDAICKPEISRRPFMAMLAAQAADGLGRRREALALIEPAMPEIERSGIALTIERAYRIAGQITNDRRYSRKADEVERAAGV